MKSAIVSGFLIASLIPWLARVQDPPAADTAAECPDIHVHQPVVVYEVAGATLSGQVDRTLVVYGDGTLKLASAVPDQPGSCAAAQTSPDRVADLYNGLVKAGALSFCDDEVLAIDLPLRTLTILAGAHVMRGRAFSWWTPDGAYSEVEALLEQFISEHFPG